jgi:hypothetical protein
MATIMLVGDAICKFGVCNQAAERTKIVNIIMMFVIITTISEVVVGIAGSHFRHDGHGLRQFIQFNI